MSGDDLKRKLSAIEVRPVNRGRSPCFVFCGDDICRDHGCRHIYRSPAPSSSAPAVSAREQETEWAELKRLAEQQTAALRKIADFKPRLRQTNVLEYVQAIARAALRAGAE